MTHPVKRVTVNSWHRAYIRLSAALKALMATPWTEGRDDDDGMFNDAARSLDTAAAQIEQIVQSRPEQAPVRAGRDKTGTTCAARPPPRTGT